MNFNKNQVKFKIDEIPGLFLIQDYLTDEEELNIILQLEDNEWDNNIYKYSQEYGYKYNKNKKILEQTLNNHIELYLRNLIIHIHDDIDITFNQIIVDKLYRYNSVMTPGTILDEYSDTSCYLNLSEQYTLNFINPLDEKHIRILDIKPKSLLIFTGDSRYLWQHYIDSKLTIMIPDPYNENKFIKIKKDKDYELYFLKLNLVV